MHAGYGSGARHADRASCRHRSVAAILALVTPDAMAASVQLPAPRERPCTHCRPRACFRLRTRIILVAAVPPAGAALASRSTHRTCGARRGFSQCPPGNLAGIRGPGIVGPSAVRASRRRQVQRRKEFAGTRERRERASRGSCRSPPRSCFRNACGTATRDRRHSLRDLAIVVTGAIG